MPSILSERIAALRKERGLTQEQLGKMVGVSSQAVGKWEKGGAPDVELLPALSDILGVTVDALFGRTEAKREDMEEVVGRYIASLPKDKRIERLISLMRKVMLTGCIDEITDFMDFEHCDSEATYISRDGIITAVSSGKQSFISAIRNAEGLFDDLLLCDENVTRLFSALSCPHALTMLSNLYRETPKYRTAGALALLTGITQGEAEEILLKFTELRLTEELELETENGSAKAYTVNLTGTTVPFLFSARLMTQPTSYIKVISDRRIPASSDDNA